MKKRKIAFLILGLFMLFLIFGGFSLIRPKDNDEKVTNSKKIKLTNQLSMMLETGAGTGVYETTTRSTWPTEGYLFNEELSKCENGGKLSWNDENNTVVMTGSTSDKCYVYFDVYNLAVINNVTADITNNQVILTVNAVSGTKPITKYYYSKDNGTTYIESTSNTYIFSNLNEGTTYNMKVYLTDSNSGSSNVFFTEVETLIKFKIENIDFYAKKGMTLQEWIKSDYNTNNTCIEFKYDAYGNGIYEYYGICTLSTGEYGELGKDYGEGCQDGQDIRTHYVGDNLCIYGR